MPPPDHEREKIERLRRAMYSRGISDKIGEHERHELETEKGVVGEDWGAPDESIAGVSVAPRVVGATRAILKGLLIAGIVFCVVAVGFFVYFFTLGAGSSNSSNNVNIIVNGPPEINSGNPVELQVAITNKNNVPLELADLVVTYPAGTRSVQTAPSQDSCDSVDIDPATGDMRSQRLCLGTIAAGDTRQGTITQIFSGSSNARTVVRVELQYRLKGSNAIFTASKEYALTFKTSSLALSIAGNSETVSGQPVQFTVSVASNAEQIQHGVLLHIDYPFGFTFKSANPAPISSGTWNLGDVFPTQTKKVQIFGTMKGQPGDQRIFRLSAGIGGASSTVSTHLADDTYRIKISDAFLGLGIQVNTGKAQEATSTFSGVGSATPYATPGSMVSVSIRYINNLSSEIDHAVVVAKLSGAKIDGSTVLSGDGVYRSSDGVVYWDESTSGGKLGVIAPGENGTLTFSFRVPTDAPAGQNPRIDVSVNAAGKRMDETGVPQSLQAAVVQKILIASQLQLEARGLYLTNLFGSGPLPPLAEVETTYAMVFTARNSTNPVKNARLTAHLPPYVRWTGGYTPQSEHVYVNGEQIRSDGQILRPPVGDPCVGVSDVCWSIGSIAAGTGVNGTAPREAAIGIGFTPSTSQIGQTPVLLQNIVLSGTDETTGQNITIRSDRDITTNLVDDPNFNSSQASVKGQ